MPLITFLILAYFFPDKAGSLDTLKECDNLQVAYTVDAVPSSQESKIQVTVKGGKQPYYYFFLDKKKNPLTWEFDKNQYSTKGKVMPSIVRVVDAEGCMKTIELNESHK